MARLIEGEPLPALRGVEAGVWRACGIRATEMNWWQYALAILAFNLLGLALLFALLMTQGSLPLNPQGFPGLSWDLALNTAVSFVTNTNWQAYSGESALSYFSQMAGLAVQNFVSASTGYAACVAFCRGLTGTSKNNLGNFYVDLVRITTRILIPFSIIVTLILVWQGAPQNFMANQTVTTIEGTQQDIAMGPIASLVSIKHLGTNGGGFLGANSTTPLENPTIISDITELLSMMILPGACVIKIGRAHV